MGKHDKSEKIEKTENIDLENNRLNVLIDLFGQETPVEVEVYQVSKA